jgi:hexosaminidase
VTGRPGRPVTIPAQLIADGPRFAWRSLSVDLARQWFTAADVERIVDLAALYKFDVVNLHLTDDQGWRLPAGRPEGAPAAEGSFYADGELRALVAHAAEQFVTLVPEVDMPGHVAMLFALRPELASGRNTLEIEFAPGWTHQTAWLDPEHPATFPVVEEVLAAVADLFPSEVINLGGDEPYGMPVDLYRAFIAQAREMVRALGRRTMGWQESIRAGTDPTHMIQHWIALSDADDPVWQKRLAHIPPAIAQNLLASRDDIEAAIAASVPIVVSPSSHAYLDVPHAEEVTDPEAEARRQRVGLRWYPARTVAASFDWDPVAVLADVDGADAGVVAGAGACMWCETVTDVDDLTFMLLPRLAGVAQKAWSAPGVTWADHRVALAPHARLWDQDGLTWFPSPGIDW